MTLQEQISKFLQGAPDVAAILGISSVRTHTFSEMAGMLLGGICANAQTGRTVASVYESHPQLVELSIHDIEETARRNCEPGELAATVLFSRGVHAIMGHRVAHQLWQDGNMDLALALKAVFGRAFSTDIHPAAQFGAGLWLDHGLGFVVGETTVLGDNVSIWHNVTLGSSLTGDAPDRHPKIGSGAVIGAGAILLGNIKVGENANIAAGAIVLEDVPAGTVMVGTKARNVGAAKVSFTSVVESSNHS